MLTERRAAAGEWVQVAMPVALALVVGVYLLISMPVIERDGVTFIQYAKGLELDAGGTIAREYQHPGYPAMILLTHQVSRAMGAGESLMGWVYSAQAASLFFRVAAMIPLYFVGRRLVGVRGAFWGSVLIAILPGMAEYGSDALADWPNEFFFACGILALLTGLVEGRIWLFGLAGLSAGLGYLVRPECAIVAAIGGVWAGWQAVSGRNWPRKRAILAGVLLVAGFALAAGPYMVAKGAVFPKKHVGEFASRAVTSGTVEQGVVIAAAADAGSVGKVFGSGLKLITRMGEVLSWFFLPIVLLGTARWFSDPPGGKLAKFVVWCLLGINVPVLIWLHVKYGYMSRRHILGMASVLVFFAPAGIDVVATWCARAGGARTTRAWWTAVLAMGVVICMFRLWGLSDNGRRGYIPAAGWLKANTAQDCFVAAPDARIAFYAQRQWIRMEDGTVPPMADYYVMVSREGKVSGGLEGAVFEYQGLRRGEMSVTIYRQQH